MDQITPILAITAIVLFTLGAWFSGRVYRKYKTYRFYTQYVDHLTATELIKIAKREWFFNTLTTQGATLKAYPKRAEEFNIKFNNHEEAFLWASTIVHCIQPAVFPYRENNTAVMKQITRVVNAHFQNLPRSDVLRICLWACLLNPHFKDAIKEL